MNTVRIIGANIQKYRKIQGLSQQKTADYLGVTRELISLYESGKRDATLSNLNRLADLFGIDLADLLEEDPEIQNVNIAFAFRSEETEADLISIASFQRIVLNYLKIDKIRNEG